MDSYLYFCTECNKLFKVADTGRKVKCSHCSKPLVDLEITDTEYAALDPDKREALKNKARESEKVPDVETKAPEAEIKAPESETKAPEPEIKVPEAETKTPEVTPAVPENTEKEPEKKTGEKPRNSGLFDINALLYGSAGVDAPPEVPPAGTPETDINTILKATPEPETSTPAADINAVLKAAPEPETSALATDINAILKATPEPEASAPAADINAVLKTAPEPETSAPATDINAILKATPEPEASAPSTDINTDTDTDTDINSDTESDINTDSISAFFDIGDSFKDPYMSEGDSDDEGKDTQEEDEAAENRTITDKIAETGEQLASEIGKQSDEIIAVRNNYLKIQIQNQLLAVDNFMSICKLSALQDDGVVDKDEEKLLKRLEKATDDYKKALNRLVR